MFKVCEGSTLSAPNSRESAICEPEASQNGTTLSSTPRLQMLLWAYGLCPVIARGNTTFRFEAHIVCLLCFGNGHQGRVILVYIITTLHFFQLTLGTSYLYKHWQLQRAGKHMFC